MLNKNFWSQACAAFHKVIHSAWAFALVALLAPAAVRSAQAATRYRTGGGSDTLWSTAGNWKDNAAPGEGDAAQFRADQVGGAFTGKTVTLRDAYTINVLHVSNGSSASEPIVFEADQNSAHGVTVSDDVWLGYYADGALWLQSGTYTFAKSLNVGVGAKSSTHNFWLKVGDGSSTVSLTAKAAFRPWPSCIRKTLDRPKKAVSLVSPAEVSSPQSSRTWPSTSMKGRSQRWWRPSSGSISSNSLSVEAIMSTAAISS